MALINPFGPGFLEWMGGIATAILGKPGRWNFNRQSIFTMFDSKIVPVDVSKSNLMSVAQNVPHLNVVISRRAQMFANMAIKHLNAKGEEIEVKNSDVLKFLKKPTPLQRQKSWLYNYAIYEGIYTMNFGFMNRGTFLKKTPATMPWLPPGLIDVLKTGKLYRQHEMKGIIEGFKMYGDEVPFKPEEVLMIAEGMAADGIIPQSRISALQIPLANIMASLKSVNIITTERGLIGFIASDGGGDQTAEALPFDDKERERIEKDYQRRRSLDSKDGHVTFSGANIKWVPMTFDMKQLMLFEGLEDAFANICAEYGMDRDIFPSVKGATFENKINGVRSTYQDEIQPMADTLMGALEDAFGLAEKGERLVACYKHLPVMQEDQAKKETARKTKIEGNELMLKSGIITKDVYAEDMEVEFHPDTSGADEKSINAQLQLRGTVGGVTGLIAMNQAVSAGDMDRDTALNIAITVYGYDPKVANLLVTTKINPKEAKPAAPPPTN